MENQSKVIPKYTVKIDKIAFVSKNIFLLRLTINSKQKFKFIAGQYIWLILDHLLYPDDRGERRAFSIISSDSQKSYIELLVRDSNSGYKRTIKELKPGTKASIIGPFGHSMIIPDTSYHKLNFIAGGVAVAPFLGNINSMADKPKQTIRFLHFVAKNNRDLNILDLVKNLKQQNIQYSKYVQEFSGNELPTDIDYKLEHFYITGPQEFVNKINEFMVTRGVTKDQLHYEENHPQPVGNMTIDDLQAEEHSFMYQAIQDSKSHTIITDANGMIIFANPAAETTTGYTFKEMIGSSPRLWGGLMPLEFYNDFWLRKHSPQGFDGEITNHRKNGEIYTAVAHISPLYSATGEVIGYIGTEEDITETVNNTTLLAKKNVELERVKAAMLNVLEDLNTEKQHLLEANARDEAIFSAVADGFVVTDKNGLVIKSNKAARDAFEMQDEDIINKKLVSVVGMTINGTDVAVEDRLITKALQQKSSIITDVTTGIMYKTKSGKEFPVAITTSPIIASKTLLGAVEIFRDISKESEIDKAKTEFVSLASHQLRTPLSAINWFSEMLINGDAGKLNTEQREYITEIYASNSRMVKLINSLLNVSRLELGTFAFNAEKLNIPELAKQVNLEVSSEVKKRGQKLQVEIDKTVRSIIFDSQYFVMILQNLLSNAIKYTPAKGSISLSIKPVAKNKQVHGYTTPDVGILVSVSDSGYGIPSAQQDKIFTKMFQADNVREKDTDGTGLGLYIIKTIVEHSHGHIWFDSKLNKGTCFYVFIPNKTKSNHGTKKLE